MANYLCFTANTAGSTVKLGKNGSPAWSGSYSTDGSTWTTYTPGTTGAVTLTNKGDKVYFKGTQTGNFSASVYLKFSMTGSVAGSGNCMSLWCGDSFESATAIPYQYAGFYLFYGCSSLTSAPELPATTITTSCYSYMFYGCTSLINPPELPALTLASTCYAAMFWGCTSLTKTPELPATEISAACYQYMFYGCTSITFLPELPATTLKNYCYAAMFQNCSSIKLNTGPDGVYLKEYRIPSSGTGTTTTSSMAGMFSKTGGVFTGNPTINTTYYTIEEEKNLNYLYYGVNNTTLYLSNSKTTNSTIYNQAYNIQQYKDTITSVIIENNLNLDNYNYLFANFSKLTSITGFNNINLNNKTAKGMFKNCTSLTSMPSLTATELARFCYAAMFYNCTSLTTLQSELPSTTLAEFCYVAMFGNCTSLKSTLNLPASTLQPSCYRSMFANCTSLTNILSLAAVNLADNCYRMMFNGCSSLTSTVEFPAQILKEYCYYAMFQYCTSLVDIKPLNSTNLATYCYAFMFYNCSSLTKLPNLQATTLADGCYYGMFQSCTSLKSLPVLPATTLMNSCYRQMFYGCTSIQLSEEKDEEYRIPYRIPLIEDGTTATYATLYMLGSTGGSFTGAPEINTTYYIKDVNAISNTVNRRLGDSRQGCANIYVSGLKDASEKILPDEYTQLEYIQATGAQYIDTGYDNKHGFNAVLKASFADYSKSNCLIGSIYYNGSTYWRSNFQYYYNSSAMQLGFYSTYNTFTALTLNQNYDVEVNTFSGNGYVKIDGETKLSSTVTFSDSSSINLYLMANNYSGDYAYFRGKVYYCEIRDEGGNLIRNYIPCTNSSGTVGMYDTVGKTFYGSATSTAFIAGPEVIYTTSCTATTPSGRKLNGKWNKLEKYNKDENTILLIHGDNFLEKTNEYSIKNYGVTLSSDQHKYFDTSMYFDGSSAYLNINVGTFMNFGTGDFTLEMWIYPTNFTKGDQFMLSSEASPTNGWFLGHQKSSNTLGLGRAGIAWDIANGVVTENTWSHIAYVRNNGTVYIFINGILQGTVSDTQSYNLSSSILQIGCQGSGYYYAGYIDEIRISNIARWTSSFSIYEEPYSNLIKTTLNVYKFIANEYGTYSIKATDGTNQCTQDVEIDLLDDYYISLSTFSKIGGLVTWLKGSDFTDYSKNSSTFSGSVLPTLTTYNFDKESIPCYLFDSQSMDLRSTDTPFLTMNSGFTVSQWVYITSKPSYSTLWYIAQGSYCKIDSCTTMSTGGYLGYAVRNSSGSSLDQTTSYTPPLNTVLHLVATYSSSTGSIKSYVNGIFVATSTVSPNFSDATINDLRIGWNGYASSNERYMGYMTDFRIYNYEFSADEVEELYLCGTQTE